MNITIATLNVKGMAGSKKFSTTANLLKTYSDIDVFTLQETNIKKEKLEFAAKRWGLESIWTPHVAILINNKKISIENSLSPDSRILIADLRYNNTILRVETVYIPPDKERRAAAFLDFWTPWKSKDKYILTGDFNINIHSKNRRGMTKRRNDATRESLLSKLDDMVDTQTLATVPTLQTFFQHTANNNYLANKLDYIYVSPDFEGKECSLETRAGNSDHLLLVACFSKRGKVDVSQWRLNTRLLEDYQLIEDSYLPLENFEDWDQAKSRSRMILMSKSRQMARKRKSAINRLQRRITEHKLTLVDFPNAEDLQSLLRKDQLELDRMIEENSTKWQIRSKARWIEEGERSTKYFYRRFQDKTLSESPTELIRDPTVQDKQPPECVLNHIADWYDTLYSEEEIHQEGVEDLLKNINSISSAESFAIMEEIPLELVQSTIKKLPNGKTPGPDGIPYEYYKVNTCGMAKALQRLFNEVLKNGTVPKSWTTSYITLIPKKEKDKSLVQNWRPIALINSDAWLLELERLLLVACRNTKKASFQDGIRLMLL